MLSIRLKRIGKKKQPIYRVIILDKKKDPWGNYLENLGTYNPRTNPSSMNLKADRIKYWLSVGAQPSPTIHNLLVDEKIIDGKKVKATSTKKKDVKKADKKKGEEKEETKAEVKKEVKSEEKKEDKVNDEAKKSDLDQKSENKEKSKEAEKPEEKETPKKEEDTKKESDSKKKQTDNK